MFAIARTADTRHTRCEMTENNHNNDDAFNIAHTTISTRRRSSHHNTQSHRAQLLLHFAKTIDITPGDRATDDHILYTHRAAHTLKADYQLRCEAMCFLRIANVRRTHSRVFPLKIIKSSCSLNLRDSNSSYVFFKRTQSLTKFSS